MATIAVLGTLDTKGLEHKFVADCIAQNGHQVLLIDVGTGGDPQVTPHLSRQTAAEMAGVDLASIGNDRGKAVELMSQAAPRVLTKLHETGKIHAVISLGGGGGTALGTAGMRALPLGFPKLMVSTLASGNTAQYLGATDIVMMPSVVDIAGLNRISRPVLARAAGAICGMLEAALADNPEEDKPLILASMFGNTTIGVESAKRVLEAAGYEVIVFHATGTGGKTMESLIASGIAAGVLDFTTTEWADEVVGGVLSAGPARLEAAAKSGTPAIFAPGCLDMVNFFARETVPAKFNDRTLYVHNPQVTLLRTNAEEAAAIGKAVAEKLNLSTGPLTVLLPMKGVSAISSPGFIFHDPAADTALFRAIRRTLRKDIPVLEVEATVNDPAFAATCAQALLENIAKASKPAGIRKKR
jgi:uncharacterized protein (UPF0261 family)